MEFWIKAAQLLLSLSILIVLHEFGHFIPARIFKTRVEKFYLFFNYKFSLFKKKIGDTEWGIGWIPLGGYVKIAGMIDESMDKEQMAKPAEPWEFRSKPAWQRLIIMLGGVFVNLILGMIIYIGIMFTWGEEILAPQDMKNGMAVHPFFNQYDIESGDRIVKLDGEKIEHFKEVIPKVFLRGYRKVTLEKADGSIETVELPEDIHYKMFKADAIEIVGMRNKINGVKGILTDHDLNNSDDEVLIEEGSLILKIDQVAIENSPLSFDKTDNKSHTITVVNPDRDTVDVKTDANEYKDLLAYTPALKSGLLPGDKFVSINNVNIEFYDELISTLYRLKGKKAKVALLRNGEQIALNMNVSEDAKLGFYADLEDSEDMAGIQHLKYGFGESFSKGISRGYWTLRDYASQLKFIFTKKGATSVGGFGAIGSLFAPKWDWKLFWDRTALISIILAFMNILPIPALDGGHVVFLLYEMITGREAPEKVLEYAQYIGFFLIIGLVIFANGNDIYRWLMG